jgi:tetratricopeptide (TPR) repeat protein
MKKIFIILIFGIISPNYSQTYKKIRRVVPIIESQNFYLNGATKGAFGGNSRTSLLISLPKNTVEWYYIISTTPNQSSNVNLNLVSQLTRLIDHSGMTALATSSLFAPSGNGGACDIYLMNRSNKDDFIRKAEMNGGNFYYQPEGSRESFLKGAVQVKSITLGDWYLGFRNRSISSGVNIYIEVAAIVEEVEFSNTWTSDAKNGFYNKFYNTLIDNKLSNDIAKEIADCMVNKVVTQKTPELWESLSDESKLNQVKEYFSSCSEKYEVKKSPEQDKGMTFGNLGWKAYENGELDKAIEYSKKALTFDNTLGFVKANLGLFMLIKGDENTATDYYVDSISDLRQNKIIAKRSLEAVIDDINQAIRRYSNFKGYNTILDLIKEELKRY